MSSPRVIASLLAVAIAGIVISSCGDQPSPTVATPVTAPVLRTAAVPATEFVEMLADPAAPLGTLADPPPPVVYPPNSPPDPWPPGPPPKAQPGVPVPTEPTATARLHITIMPEPVTHSGVPVPTSSCATNHPYTWYYDQTLNNDTGLKLTFTQRDNFFDGRFSGTNGETIEIPGNRSVTIHTRWCSGYAKPHYAQTRFKGRDETGEAVEVSAPWVRLLTP
jgi:hypothetical protein